MSIVLLQPPLFEGPAAAAFLLEQIIDVWQTPEHQRFLHAWMEDFYTKKMIVANSNELDLKDKPRWLTTLDRWINQSPLYALEEDVAALVQVGAESMPEQKVLQTDLPGRSGFILFPRPVGTVDRNLETYGVSGVFWLPALGRSLEEGGPPDHPGVMTVHFTSNNDLAREIADWPKVAAEFPPLSILHLMFLPFGTQLAPPTGEHPEVAASTMRFIKHLQSFWAFVQQKVVEVETTQTPRPIRRRAEKVNRKVSELKVVRLRRIARHSVEHAAEGGKEIHWSHRWIVRGHWRQQWYATINDHRAVWIYPYVKGPEERPLKMRRTIFDVKR